MMWIQKHYYNNGLPKESSIKSRNFGCMVWLLIGSLCMRKELNKSYPCLIILLQESGIGLRNLLPILFQRPYHFRQNQINLLISSQKKDGVRLTYLPVLQ